MMAIVGARVLGLEYSSWKDESSRTNSWGTEDRPRQVEDGPLSRHKSPFSGMLPPMVASGRKCASQFEVVVLPRVPVIPIYSPLFLFKESLKIVRSLSIGFCNLIANLTQWLPKGTLWLKTMISAFLKSFSSCRPRR